MASQPSSRVKQNFGVYSDPLSDPRGEGYSAISRMSVDAADDAAEKQAHKDLIASLPREKSGRFSITRIVIAIAAVLLAVPLLFVLHPAAGFAGMIALVVWVFYSGLRS